MVVFERSPKHTLFSRGWQRPGGQLRSANILMRVECTGMTYWWRRELVVTDQGFEWEIWKYQHRVKMTLPYERMAHVRLLAGRTADTIEVTGTTGSDDLLVSGINRVDATRLLAIVERHIGGVLPARLIA